MRINVVMCNYLLVVNANEIGPDQIHNYKLEEQHNRLFITGGGRVRVS